MKLTALFILLLVVACDPYGFGYKKNPAFVLNEAFKAINQEKLEKFLDLTGKEALCIYGNKAGLEHLKDHLNVLPEDLELKPTGLEARSLKHPISTNTLAIPQYAGFWSYYQERYVVEVHHAPTSGHLLNVVVDCNFGIDGKKDPKYAAPAYHQKPKKYPMKDCRITKIVPTSFPALAMDQKCDMLKIQIN